MFLSASVKTLPDVLPPKDIPQHQQPLPAVAPEPGAPVSNVNMFIENLRPYWPVYAGIVIAFIVLATTRPR